MVSNEFQHVTKSLSVIAASLAFLAGAPAQPQPLASLSASFHAHRDFPAPGASVPAQGDINNDGILDLVVPNLGANTVNVLLGNADGTFQAPVRVNAGTFPSDVVIGDFNRDGVMDIAVCTQSGIAIILGEGGVTFGAPTIVAAGTTPMRIIAADFNKDRKLDLAVANFDSNDVSVFLGKGDGTFTESATIGVGRGPLGLAAADLNGDGHTDLVVSNSGNFDGQNHGSNPNTLTILLGIGDGTFQTPAFLPMQHAPEGIAIADFNQDGKADVAVALSASNQVATMMGNGNGTFRPARLFTVFPQAQSRPGVRIGPANVALADFNGDGKLDLAMATTTTSTVGVLFGDGAGNFNSPQNIEVSRTPVWVLTGDYNHDGKADFISSNNDAGTVSVVLGNGDGTFLEAPVFSLGAQPRQMVVADFNSDGVPDLAAVGGFGSGPANSLAVLLGKQGGGFDPKNVTNLNGNITGLVAKDVNRDGHIDLLGTNFGTPGSDPGGIAVLLGKGDGTFQPAVNMSAGSNPILIAVADFNGDGKPDAVVSNRLTNADALFFLPGDGKGGFGAPSNILSFSNFATVNILLAGDFNGDGKADIAYVKAAFNFTLSVQFGNGDGTFQPPKVLVTLPPSSVIFAVAAGDFNNDGSPDFAVEEGGKIQMLVGDGKGNFVSKGKFSENELSSFSFVAALVLADFNGDGLLDVAAADGFDDNVPVLLGNGDGTLGKPNLVVGGGHTTTAVAADFNGDGHPDIALATFAPTAAPNSPGEVILLHNTTH